ncbi:MAG: hypothetical protein FWE07_08215, partial [Turicibacter sp.]|nr:hypothetical protein [Turicibacter sp.]
MNRKPLPNRLLTILVALAMLVSSMPINALAYTAIEDGLTDDYHDVDENIDNDDITEDNASAKEDATGATDADITNIDDSETDADVDEEDDVDDVDIETLDGAIYAGTWFESAFAIWDGAITGEYRAYVRLTPDHNAYYWRDGSAINDTDPDWDIAQGWTAVDAELIRLIDPARGLWRVDVPGLPHGTYDIQVMNADDEIVDEFEALETTSFPRLGAAFVPSNEIVGNSAQTDYALYGATGGYLSDGRIDPDAMIMY